MRSLACASLVAACLSVVLVPASPASAEGSYSPPVAGPIVEAFRLDAGPYGPGNRGIDYATEPGAPVRAAADGVVAFAGLVAGSRHVVLLHDDGLRTSYSFLASTAVRRGDRVVRGEVVGASGSTVHFGVRAGDRYLDPAPLLRGEPPVVRLVPLEARRAGSVADEVAGLVRSLVGAGARAAAAGVDWARREVVATWELVRAELVGLALTVQLLGHYADLPARIGELALRARAFLRSQEGCTPSSVATRRRRSGRRIAVLVGGLGSSSSDAAVLDLDTRALGYGDDDVAQFSYRGGQSPGRRRLDGIDLTTYGPPESTEDVRVAADRLRALLQSIRLRHPGVPVDLIAHSQGGIVARLALGEPFEAVDARLPRVEHLVTLGTPHQGADLATANAALGGTTLGPLVQAALAATGVAAMSPAVAQLAETSGVMATLRDRPLPVGARVTSIAARGDLVAPALSSALAGATNVVVPVDGVRAHDVLPGSPEAAREVALALAGQGPTCRGLVGDLLLAGGIGLVEDGIGGALTAVDAANPSMRPRSRPAGR